jgi:tetratricopeptide (TPR) repeat protein
MMHRKTAIHIGRLFWAAMMIVALLPSCTPKRGTVGQAGQESVVRAEPVESIDWSTVTPESLWDGVFQLHETEGPRTALVLLDRGVQKGIVSRLEADQVRAGYLYELGRFDEAFLALVRYRLDASRPDLLVLRAELLWAMSRYGEARRDYEALLAAQGDEPESSTLFALARLYDDLGEWDKSDEMRGMLLDRSQGDQIAAQWALYDAIQSEEPERIRQAISNLEGIPSEAGGEDAFVALGRMYAAFLEGSATEAVRTGREFLTESGPNQNVIAALLYMDAETGDFRGFETDLGDSLDKLEAREWLDPSASVWASLMENQQAIGALLDSASALELGRGNRDKARVLGERAKELNPYDQVALLQLAAVKMTERDIAGAFELLNEAAALEPPSGIRTRLRMIQFSRLVRPGVEVPWDVEAVAAELEEMVDHWSGRYPHNSFYLAAKAELAGFRGNLDEALRIYAQVTELPGATRESRFRRAYFLARDGQVDEAWRIVEEHFPESSPYLTWASELEQEAAAQSDANLAMFSTMLRNRLDPVGNHGDFFATPSNE